MSKSSALPRLVAQSGHSLGIGREITAIALYFLHRAEPGLFQSTTAKTTATSSNPSLYNSDLLAMAAILLACKVAEREQSLRDVMNVVESEAGKITQEGAGAISRQIRMPEMLDESYHALKNKVISAEFTLLDALDFDIEPPSSYEHLLLISNRLGLVREVNQVAWVVLSDAYMHPCCLGNDVTLAASAVVVAAMLVGQGRGGMGDRKAREEQFWTDFGVDTGDITRVCREILGMYEEGCRK